MRTSLLLLAAAALVTVTTARAAGPELKTDDDKTFYALGLALSRSVAQFNLTPAEVKFVEAGLADGVAGTPRKEANLETYGPKIQEMARSRAAKGATKEKEAGKAYAEKAASESGAKQTGSGLVYKEVKEGDGDSPKATDKVKVHYTGKLIDGTVFDSSVERGEPVTFPLNGVIKCWTEGLQMMKVGGKATLVCPSDIAYGDQGRPPQIKGGATLVFDVELLGIEK
jgi:FKBP-type peptidyl-prolyl cis-trans isomerase FkpA